MGIPFQNAGIIRHGRRACQTGVGFARTLLRLPQNCHLCGAASGGSALCPGCRSDLPRHAGPRCPVCAAALPHAAPACGRCLAAPPAFDATWAACDYLFPADVLVQQLKFGRELALAAVLGECLATAVAGAPRPDLLVPVPLAPARLRRRGFNQAMEIGRTVARRTGVRIDGARCERVRETAPQAGQSLEGRAANMRHAFRVRAPVAGLRVAMLDDVMTSGATLNAMARVLKASGAAWVGAWVVARTPLHADDPLAPPHGLPATNRGAAA